MRAGRNEILVGGKDAHDNPEKGKVAASSENTKHVSAHSQMEVLTLSTGNTMGTVCSEMDVRHTNKRIDETKRTGTGHGRNKGIG